MSDVKSLEMDDLVVHLVRKKVRNLRISIHAPHGSVRVSAPLRMNEALIRLAISEKLPWIRRKQADVATRQYEPSVDEAWGREYLRAQIPPLQARWEPHIGVIASEVRIRRMKTRWGSCNIRTRRIWLNLELANKSPACLEYVFVHELVHFIERGHGERFRTLMDCFLPEWRAHRAELNGRHMPILLTTNNHLTEHRAMEAARLYESPFTDLTARTRRHV